MPAWLPWIFVGGLAFMILSFIASKYKDKDHKPITFAQDFISGAVVISLLGVLVPDAFPAFPISSKDIAIPNLTGMMQSATGDNDIALQIGPLRR
jgi:uncharacterized membrane protein